MTTSQYFIEDDPIQILYLDNDSNDARHFFDMGLGSTWFDYDLHVVGTGGEATKFLTTPAASDHLPSARPIDLLLISNRCWNPEGQELVRQVRRHEKLHNIPVYCVASCPKKINSASPQCWNEDWRFATDCDKDARIAAIPFSTFLNKTHKTRLDGVICANNLEREISSILNHMTHYWFCG